MKSIFWKSIPPLIVGVLIALAPAPVGLSAHAWYFCAVFAAVIIALILEPIPAAAIGFIGVAFSAVFCWLQNKPVDSIQWALSGFSNTTVWLIFAAFMFALGYEKTGLGKRIALILVKKLGGKTLGLGYAIAISDLVIAPFTPSNTARSGGTIFPIIKNLPSLYGSAPGETARKIGSYIMWTAFAVTCVTSSMFLTALAPNLLALELINKTSQIGITWTEWMIGFLPTGVLLIIALPYLIFKIYPPEIKTSREVSFWAAEEVRRLGALSYREVVMALLAILALCLWIFGTHFVDATTVAIATISLMVVTGVVKWQDILDNKQAWNVLVWFATLVGMADGLNKVGFVSWFSKSTASMLMGMPAICAMIILVVIFFFMHYMFASLTAHTTAVLPVMLASAAAIPGLHLKVFAMILCYSLGIMGVITPYASGPAPVYYGSGFISRRDFWVLGFLFGAIFLIFLLLTCVPFLLMIEA